MVTGDVTIGLLGDVMLGRKVGEELEARDPAALWGAGLRAVLASLDAVVCNLECAISARGEPTRLIPGKPFFFRAPPVAVAALEAIGVRAVTLANNHALDYGVPALADTLAALAGARIAGTGAGPDERAARRHARATVSGLELALVGVTDHPAQYAAGPASWGVAHADLRRGAPAWLLAEVAAARRGADIVIASPHWGPNMATAPAGWQRAVAGELLDAGADLVAGHSAHVFHGIGFVAGRPVLYDLGDALDDYRVDRLLRNDLGVLALWQPDRPPELVGLRLDYARTDLATGADAEWIARRLATACGELGSRVTRLGEQRFRIEPA